MADARLAYAGARVRARVSRRPGAPQWGALDASRTPQHYVAALRTAGWLRIPEADVAGDPDARERWLREAWREACLEVAAWYPAEWRNAVAWLARLADLDGDATSGPDDSPLTAWRRGFHGRLPEDAEARRHLHELERAIQAASSLRSAARREALESAAFRMLRRAGTGAATGFAYLLLIALRLERVRGGLASRAVPARSAA